MAPCSTISGCLCRRRRSSDGPGARGVGLGPDRSACRCRPAGKPIKVALIESLSGTFANTGEAVFRNVYWAMERVNARGGVALPATAGGKRPLVLERYDSKGQNEEALSALRAAIDDGAQVILQGNSSATAAVLIEAINKHNEREPGKRVLFLNFSAVDPILTNEKCSFWHFRFDAHADMRMAALMEVMREDKALKSVYLIGQDYSFGQAVLREGQEAVGRAAPRCGGGGRRAAPGGPRQRLCALRRQDQEQRAGGGHRQLGQRPDPAGESRPRGGLRRQLLHLLRQRLGAPPPWVMRALARWWPWPTGCPMCRVRRARAFYQSFRERFPKAAGRLCAHAHAAHDRGPGPVDGAAGTTDVVAVARQMEKPACNWRGRAAPCVLPTTSFSKPWPWGVMDKKGAPGVKFDVEGSGYGFRVVRQIPAARRSSRTAATCSGLDSGGPAAAGLRLRGVSAAGGQSRVACGGHFAPQLNHRHGVVSWTSCSA